MQRVSSLTAARLETQMEFDLDLAIKAGFR